MSESTHPKLPYLAASQAQKHVTVNEGLAKLDILVQCAIIEFYRNDPPASPADGDRYITGGEPTGAWADKPYALAAYVDGVWGFHAPKPGWRVYNLADDTLYALDASFVWVKVGLPESGAEIQNVALFGLGITADASNPFSAKLNAPLWTARYAGEGGSGDLFYTMNKEAAAGDLGYVFQTDFVTKALVGPFGSDKFPRRRLGRRQHLLRRLHRRQRDRHCRSAAAAALDSESCACTGSRFPRQIKIVELHF